MNTIIDQFDLHTRLYNNLLYEVSNEASEKCMTDGSNHLKWIAGHLLSTRYSLCPMVRLDVKDPFLEFFGHGAKVSSDINYPSLEAIQEKWNEISDDLSKGLSTLPEKLLVKEAKIPLPNADKTLKGMLGFMMHHEGYHLGQISMLRRFVGNGKMSYR